MQQMTNTEKNVLTLTEKVSKCANSKKKFIRIPEKHFDEISFGDTAGRIERHETKDEISIVFVFKKENLKSFI